MEQQPPKNENNGLKIAGINIAIFVAYVGVFAFAGNAIFGVFGVFIAHIIICLILAIVLRKWIWALSALLILVIGFSTCVIGINAGSFR